MALHRAEVGAPAARTRVCVLDALAAHTEPVRLDRWPPELPWEAPRAVDVPPDALDAYCDAALVDAATAEVRACRAARAACPHWWTKRVPIAAAAPERVDLARAVADAAHGAPPPLVHTLVTNAGAAGRVVTDGTHTYELPARAAFLLTDLLPATPRALPAGMDRVHELGTSQTAHGSGRRGRRRCAPARPTVAEPVGGACAAWVHECARLRHDAGPVRHLAAAADARAAARAPPARRDLDHEPRTWRTHTDPPSPRCTASCGTSSCATSAWSTWARGRG